MVAVLREEERWSNYGCSDQEGEELVQLMVSVIRKEKS
jgi:hypothetical protein